MIIIEKRSILEKFYFDFEPKSPIMVLIFMVLSLGTYFINWIYMMNLRFEKFDVNSTSDFGKAPDSNRGLIVMFLIPFSWLVSMGILKKLIFSQYLDILFWIDLVGWFLIIFLFLQYLYDFCICFGKFTTSNGFIWYLFFWVGFFPLVLLPFEMYYFMPILFFPIITIPAMQAKINYQIDVFSRVSNDKEFYRYYGSRFK